MKSIEDFEREYKQRATSRLVRETALQEWTDELTHLLQNVPFLTDQDVPRTEAKQMAR